MSVRSARRDFERATKRAERLAMSGWHELADAFDTTTDRGRELASDARERVSDARDRMSTFQRESRRRGEAARDALAGRASRRHRRSLFIAAIAGVGVGAALMFAARRLAAASQGVHDDLTHDDVLLLDTDTDTDTDGLEANPLVVD